MESDYRFGKNLLLAGTVNLFGFIKGLIFLPLITKTLGSLDYGIWSQLGISLSLLSVIFLAGLPQALVRFLAVEESKEKIASSLSLILITVFLISLTGFLLLFSFNSEIAVFFQCQPGLVKTLALILLVEPLVNTLMSSLQAFQKITAYFLLNFFWIFSEIALIFLAIGLNRDLGQAFLSMLAIRIILLFILLKNTARDYGFKKPEFKKLTGYFKFGLPSLLSSFFYWIVSSGDRYLIGLFMGTVYVGYYSSAYVFGSFFNLIILPMVFIMFPATSRFFDKGEIEKTKDHLNRSLKYFLLVATPMFFGLAILAKPLLILATNKETAEKAFFIIPIIAASMILYGLYNILNNPLLLYKKTGFLGLIWASAAILNIVLNLLLIPNFAILGAATATFASYLWAFLATLFLSRKFFLIAFDFKSFLKTLVASLVMLICLTRFRPEGIFENIATIILGAFVYFSVLTLIKGFDRQEKFLIKDFLKSLISSFFSTLSFLKKKRS